jgi:hypothetical protein
MSELAGPKEYDHKIESLALGRKFMLPARTRNTMYSQMRSRALKVCLAKGEANDGRWIAQRAIHSKNARAVIMSVIRVRGRAST